MTAQARPTLLSRLLIWMLGALLVVWLAFVVLGWRTGVHEADELTDGHLASAAALLLRFRSSELAPRAGPDTLGPFTNTTLRSHDYQQSLSVVVWDSAGRVLSQTGEAPTPAFDAGQGFADLKLGPAQTEWRSFSRWDTSEPPRKVMVLLNREERDDLAEDIASQIAEPGLLLLPVIAIVLGLAMRRGLEPLRQLSREVATLDVEHGRTLTQTWRHAEFEAVVRAINTLVVRQQATLQRERQLTGELAHELRTPLTSLALNARALGGPLTDSERSGALMRLEQDSRRTAEVLTHLLTLARASRTEMLESATSLDVYELARALIAELAPAAHARGHELALSGQSFVLEGHAVLLDLALRNLIGNALDHTGAGAVIEVRVDPARRELCVCDDGGRVDRLAEPRQRRLGLGLGLGHRVVEKIATIHNATFSTAPPPADMTTCYRIAFGGSGASPVPVGGAEAFAEH